MDSRPTRPRDPLWKIRPDGSLEFEPSSPGQRAFINSPAREILFSGMYGNGKSVAMCIKAWKLCERYPGIQGAIVRRHYEALKISTLRLLARILGERLWRAGAQGGKEPTAFVFPNGSAIDFLGISGDNDRTKKLLSTDYGFLMADEVNELTESEWELGMGRLRQATVPIQQAFGSCNPGPPTHWLYRRFGIGQGAHREWREDDCPRCSRSAQTPEWQSLDRTNCIACHGTGKVRRLTRELFMSGAHDNDENHPPEYVAWRNGLTGVQAARYRDGKWVAFEGCVFEDYDPNVHCCDAPASWAEWGGYAPPDWPRVVGIDFGYDDPFVCEWFAIGPDNHWYRYRELYMTHRIVEKHAAAIVAADAQELAALRAANKGRPKPHEMADYLEELNIAGRYCDHDRGERETMKEHGVWNDGADKEIKVGLDSVRTLMDPRQHGGTHLHLIRGAALEVDRRLEGKRWPTCVEDELPGYLWSQRRGGELVGVPKDLPVDKDNHGIDAVRYAVHSHLTRAQVAAF